MRRSWILVLALFSGAAHAQLAFVPSNSRASQVCVKLGERLVKVPCAPGVKPLSWSTDGRWLVLGESIEGGHYKLSLADTSTAVPNIQVLEGECSAPSWSPDGKRFVYEAVGNGILIRDVSIPGQDSTVVISKGKSPNWSPRGGRIAVLPTGSDTGVILCDDNGRHVRHLPLKQKATRLAWSPAGDKLAVASGGAIWMLSTSGRGSERLCDAEDAHLEFSPDGTLLLCQVEGAWGTLELATRKWKTLPVEFSCPPTWQGSHQVVGISQEHFVDLAVDGPSHDLAPLDEDLPVAAFALGHGTGVLKRPTSIRNKPSVTTPKSENLPILRSAPLTSRSGSSGVRRVLEYDGVSRETVVVPMLFPVCGKVTWSDTFLTSRDGGERRHHGQDLMAPKMRPLVAAFDGVVRLSKSKSHNMITLKGDDGWSVTYMHVNNDTPGTEDCAGSDLYAFAPGLHTGDRVVKGQLVGFCGNSGNAKGGAAHCHFELNDNVGGGVLNALGSLQAATHVDTPITIDPCPALKPGNDQARWDLIVTAVDETRAVVTGELIAKSEDGTLTVNLMPQKLYLHIGSNTKIRFRGTIDQLRGWEDLKAGVYLSVLGPAPEAGRAIDATEVDIGESLRR